MSRTLIALLAAGLLAAGCGGGGDSSEPEKPSAEAGADAAKAGAEAAKENAKKVVEARPQKPSKDPIPAPADVAEPPADAQKTASGLAYKVLTAGTGSEHAGERDTVKVHYTGWTTDGKMFDSSVQRGRESTFPLNRVIAGWTEGLQLMVVGEKTRFWIPEDLAYKGRPGKPAGMLVFDVELFEITKAPEPPPVPADVAAPPADATKTESGLAIKFLSERSAREGRMRPGPISLVQVHYTGWTTDGKMFDSSVTRGRPAMFPLNRVIAGWTEGLQLMTEDEKARIWVPEELAYKGMAGKPAGMLVFDVELIKVMPTPRGGGTPLDADGNEMEKPQGATKMVPAGQPALAKEPAKAVGSEASQPAGE